MGLSITHEEAVTRAEALLPYRIKFDTARFTEAELIEMLEWCYDKVGPQIAICISGDAPDPYDPHQDVRETACFAWNRKGKWIALDSEIWFKDLNTFTYVKMRWWRP